MIHPKDATITARDQKVDADKGWVGTNGAVVKCNKTEIYSRVCRLFPSRS